MPLKGYFEKILSVLKNGIDSSGFPHFKFRELRLNYIRNVRA